MTMTKRLERLKDRSPRRVKATARLVTRSYGVATAGLRPYPDFFIVGTKRGGTTSLWNYLVEHPQVLPMFPRPRGLKSNAYFFEHLDKGDSWYRSHFHTKVYRRYQERSVGVTVTGEASPYYMYAPTVPARMAQVAPDARLLVLLRDPVDRAYSHYQERVNAGAESLTFEDALEAENRRLAGEAERMSRDPNYYSAAHDYYSYRDRGIYLPQLQRLHASYPQQVLVLRSEDLYTSPQAAFDTVCDFLGLDRRQLANPRVHGALPRSPISTAIEDELTRFYAPHNDALYRYLDRSFGWRRPR